MQTWKIGFIGKTGNGGLGVYKGEQGGCGIGFVFIRQRDIYFMIIHYIILTYAIFIILKIGFVFHIFYGKAPRLTSRPAVAVGEDI